MSTNGENLEDFKALESKLDALEEKLNANAAFSNFDRNLKIGLEITGLIVAIGICILTYRQTYILEKQNSIMAHQDTLMTMQTEAMNMQTELFDKQNQLFELQNSLVDTQNLLVRIQNSKVDIQNNLVQNQNKLVELQNFLFSKQNELFETQNTRIIQQTYLQEAERRSSLASFFNNVLDKVDEELKNEKNEKRTLSKELVGRIVSLSQALKPYQYLNNDAIIEKPVSPERGQLLTFLVNSELDTTTYESIFKRADFSYSELDNVELNNAYLRNVNLSNASIKNAQMSAVDFTNANLSYANLTASNMQDSKFFGTNLTYSNFYTANLNEAILLYSIIKNTNFKKATMQKIQINSCFPYKLNCVNESGISIDVFPEINFTILKADKPAFTIFQNEIYNCNLSKIARAGECDRSTFLIDGDILENVDFDSTDLSFSKLTNVSLHNCSFLEAELKEIKFERVIITNTNFEKATIDLKTYKATFQNATLPYSLPLLSLDYILNKIDEDNPVKNAVLIDKGWSFYKLKYIGKD